MKRKTKISLVIISCVLLSVCSISLSLFVNKNLNNNTSNNKEEVIDYNDYYYDNVITKTNKKLYKIVDDEITEVGSINENLKLTLEKDDYFNQGYFKIKDKDYYIDYKDINDNYNLEDKEDKDTFYLNYVPFNESIKTNDKVTLYKDLEMKDEVVTLNYSLTLPITIKETDALGIVIDDNLYYVKRSDGEIIENKNTDLKHTESLAALVYHFVYDSTNEKEKNECLNANSTICISDTKFKSHLSYLKDNGYYTATMKDLEMFLDKKVQLPYKTAVITIDDGYFVQAAIKVLEELDLHATLFLIGSAGSPDNYKSPNLELHSHSYYLHYTGACPGGQGSPLKCLAKDKLLSDLKMSRDSLNGSTVFCYPFFEYNDYAIEVLKEAGFTMAFIGGRQRITLNSNKMALPRYGIVSDTEVSDIARFVKVD